MNKEAIAEKFSNITVWKKGDERAPHKPLLVLYALGRLLKSEIRLIPYDEIERDFGKLLKEFGPKRINHKTEYPFWRLQNDQLWEVTKAEKINTNKSGDAKKSDLLKNEVKGGFPKHIYDLFRKDSKLTFEVIHELLESNFPSTIHEDILQSVGIEINSLCKEKRTRNPEFREKILKAYEYKCAVCGFDIKLGYVPIALEAAHIKWYQAGGPDIEVNGLALCALHHKLFDRGAFTLSDHMEILVSDRAYGTSGFLEWLMNYHGQKINFPQRKTYYPEIEFTTWHVREVFQGEYRELL